MTNFPESLLTFLLGEHNQLGHVLRYSNMPCIRRENVAEHSYFVVLYTMILIDRLEELGIEIDRGKALSRAAVHDIEEAITGDMPHFVKHDKAGIIKEGMELAGQEAADDLFRPFADAAPDVYVRNVKRWMNAKKDLEGAIVAVADSLSVYVYIYGEMKMGNEYSLKVADNNIEVLRKRIVNLIQYLPEENPSAVNELDSFFNILISHFKEIIDA